MGLDKLMQENPGMETTGDLSEGWLLILCGIHSHPALGSRRELPNHQPATVSPGKGGLRMLVVFNIL